MASATTSTTKAKGTKGDGPLAIAFLNDKGETSKRVSEDTAALRVTAKDGKVVDFTLSAISPATRNALVAMAAAKRIDTYVRNQAKQGGDNVVELATSVFDNLKTGTIYSRKEGAAGGAGRPFDTTFWRAIMADVAKAKKKEVSEKQLDQFEQKLKAMTPKERKAWQTKNKNDATFALALKRAEAEKLKAALKGGKSEDIDMADMF